MAATSIPVADDALITAAVTNLRQFCTPAELLFLSLLALEIKDNGFGRLIITVKGGEVEQIETTQTYKAGNIQDYLSKRLQPTMK